MSDSRPKARLREKLLDADIRGVRLEAGPLDDLHWEVPPEVQLRSRPSRVFTKVAGSLKVEDHPERRSSVLSWTTTPGTEPRGVERVPSDLLVRFASLVDAPDSAYLDFAERWGPLRLCSHGLPGSHVPADRYYLVPGLPGCPEMDLVSPVERVADWRRYASEALAIIEITSDLKDGRASSKSRWTMMRRLQDEEPFEADTLWPGDIQSDWHPKPTEREIIESQRHRLDHWINWWLALSGAGPRVQWHRGGMLTYANGGLFAALAYKLARLYESDVHIARCSICGDLIERERKPQAGRRTYCDARDCRERGRRRLSYREIAATRRSERDST